MKKKYLITALLCAVCLTGTSFAGVSAEEAEKVTEAATDASEDGSAEAESELERPDYQALDYVTPGEYKGLKIEIDPAEFAITEDDVKDRIREELQIAGLFDKISDGQVQEGDIANIDYEGKLDGQAFDGGTAQGFDLEIGSGTFIDGFEDGLIGTAVGETVDLPLTFPEGYRNNDELSGKDVVFTVTVNSVSRMPELTDELAGKVSSDEYPDAASYTDHIREELQANADSEKQLQIYRELLTLIANISKINDYPAELVDYTVEGIKSSYRQYAEQLGMDLEEYFENSLDITEEEFEEQAAEVAKQVLQQELLLKAIAEKENIEISDEEFSAGCERYAKENGFGTAEEFQAAYDEEMIRLSLLQEKVLEFVQDNAEIEEIAEEESETGASENAADAEPEEETTAG